MFVSGTLRRPAYRLYQLAWAGLDWLYPPQCGGCGQPGSRWCANCERALRLIGPPVCLLCGLPLQTNGICPDCQEFPPPFTALRSWAVYNGPLRKAFHRLKYEGDLALGETLSRPLGVLLASLSWPIEIVAPVPIGRARRKERGYNQAALLAYPLALCSGIPYQSHALGRKRETRTQVGLNPLERKLNVADAFIADREIVEGKSVLVVDDITTTGATLNACAQALHGAGARSVFGLTLARAGLDQDPV